MYVYKYGNHISSQTFSTRNTKYNIAPTISEVEATPTTLSNINDVYTEMDIRKYFSVHRKTKKKKIIKLHAVFHGNASFEEFIIDLFGVTVLL